MLPNDPKEFEEYLKKIFGGQYHHKYYDKAKAHQKEMAVHVSGDSPGQLLKKQRPNEPDDILDYRIDIWQPITKPEYGKIQAVINRIFNPRYYSIDFKDRPARIPEDADLEKYLLENYPYYRSYLVFIQQVLLPKMLEDPNAVCVIKPLYFETGDEFSNEIKDVNPIPQIFLSDRLLDFMPGKYYVIDLTDYEKHKHVNAPQKIQIITETQFIIYDKSVKDAEVTDHNLGFPPVFRLGGVICEDEYPYVYESFISAIVPHWNKAVMLQSDLDAQIVLHAYLERWEYQSVDCGHCGGTGKEPPPPGGYPDDYKEHTCSVCNGSGFIARSPFQAFTINPQSVAPGETLPIPPAGYIEKSTEIITLIDGFIDKYIKNGFKAVNMDIVNEVGEVQSGIAKTIDRQDLDAFLQNISNHLFDYVIPNIIEYTISWIYVSTGALGKVEEYEYSIIKPARFDVMSVQYLMDEFKQAREAGADTTVLNGMQISLVEKMFTGMDRQKLVASIRLNPLSGVSDDTVMSSRAMIPDEDLYIRLYISDLMADAIEEDGFLELSTKDQRERIREIARERIQNNKPKLVEAPDLTGQDRFGNRQQG